MRARAVGKKMAALLQQRLFLQGAHVTNVVFSVALLLLFYCRHLLQIKMLLLLLRAGGSKGLCSQGRSEEPFRTKKSVKRCMSV